MAYTFDKLKALLDLMAMVTELKKSSYSVKFLARRWQWGNNKTFALLTELQRNEFGEFRDEMFFVFAGINKNIRSFGIVPPEGVFPFTSEKFLRSWERFCEEKYALGFSMNLNMFTNRSMAQLVRYTALETGNPAGDEDEAIKIIERARRNNYVLHDPHKKTGIVKIRIASKKIRDEKAKTKPVVKKKRRTVKKVKKSNG